MEKKVVFLIVILLVIILFPLLYIKYFMETPLKEIRLISVEENSEISSPLEITGEAIGTWYFEASFPITLLDANGEIITQTIAKALGDWMTENFVPFKATLEFTRPKTKNGILIFENDNPSGLPEKSKKLKIPVKFKEPQITQQTNDSAKNSETNSAKETQINENSPQEKIKIKVFFSNSKLDPNAYDCNTTYPAERTVSKTKEIAKSALEELLKGPTKEELTQGFITSINPNVKIQKLAIENGIAKADFSQELQEKVGGSCRVGAIRSQITNTLKQFPSVKEVVISIDGRSEDILQP